MIVLAGPARIRPRLAHVVLAAAVGMGCGKERPFSAETAPLEGSSTSATGAGGTPSSSEASASLEGAEAADCPDADCPRGNGGNGTAEAAPSGCTANEDCSSSLTPICDLATGTCIPCGVDSDCAPERPFCKLDAASSARNACVQCTADSQCPGAFPICDLNANQCTSRCQDSAQCSGATPICDPGKRVCVQCTSSGDCAAPTVACDLATARCVECLDDTSCPEGSLCNVQSHGCVECLDSSQCLDAFNARCQTDPNAPSPFTCAGCTEDRDCAGKEGLGAHCQVNTRSCVECLTNAECTNNPRATTCSQEGTCTPCLTDADCATIPGAIACLSGSGCVECTDDSDCARTPGRPFCKLSNSGASVGDAQINTCVECTSSTDCDDPNASQCQNNACVPCQTNADCGHVDSAPGIGVGTPLNVCDAGQCVQCTGPQRQACGANVCDSVARSCTAFPGGSADICEPCVSDAHCGAEARCIQQTFGLSSVGYFCFPLATGTPASCDQVTFIAATTAATIDEPFADVCLQRQSTCPAYRAYITGVTCLGDGDDVPCGGGVDFGGACLLGPAGFACTVPCISPSDCTSSLTDCIAGLCRL